MNLQHIDLCVQYILDKISAAPTKAIILGTGFSAICDSVENPVEISFEELPNFPKPTVETHVGKFIFGTINSTPVVIGAGRFHYYEGFSMEEVVLPIRVLLRLGIQNLVLTNVSGAVNPNYQEGDFVLLKDHINLQPANPLRGKNQEELGPRFPDMTHPYNSGINKLALEVGHNLKHNIHQGVYVCLSGPNLETPAEYKFCRIIGGDVIGMSTIPEVIAANHMGISPVVLSVVSNVIRPDEPPSKTTIQSVIAVAKRVEPILEQFLKELLQKLD